MDTLMQKIEEQYELRILRHEVMRDTDKSLVIELETSKGKYIAKSLFTTEERQLFILEAEEHLRKKGIAIPEVLLTKHRERYLTWNKNLLILQRKVSGSMLALSTPSRLEATGATLGKIHAASVGFTSKNGDQFNGAKKWETEYEQDLAAMDAWNSQHSEKKELKTSLIVDSLPPFYGAGILAKQGLEQSSYFATWKKQPIRRHFLCHGDFNNGNLLIKNTKITVVDWEDVRYDFPSKDIMRVLYLLMRKKGKWSHQNFSHLMTGYLRENPLSRKQLHLLFVDLAFPHIIERFLRNQQYLAMPLEDIRDFFKREAQKTAYMLVQMKALE